MDFLYIRTQGGRGVPILLPEVTKNAIRFLRNKEKRIQNGIQETNPYLFANKCKLLELLLNCYTVFVSVSEVLIGKKT